MKNPDDARRRKLRKEFDRTVDRIWGEWGEGEDKLPGTPFEGPYDWENFEGFNTQELIHFFQDIGWAKGVSQAMGWPIGPREWSPRDKR